MKKNNKIVKYPVALNINIGVVIFTIIFIYFLFNVYTYVNAKHVTYYEVDEGSIRVRTSYSGLALREEKTVNASRDGYINYYLKDNSRAKNGSLICSIDENGDISGQIRKAGATDMRIDQENYKQLIEQIQDFCNSYDDMSFYENDTFKEDLKASLMETVNLGALHSMSEYASNAQADHTFHLQYADEPGIVSYYVDGYEQVTIDQITDELLDESKYRKTNLNVAEQVSAGEPLYKLITSERWQLVFAIDDVLADLLKDDSVIRVRFKADETTAWSNYEIISKGSKKYLVLSFTNSMIRYASERFVDVELLLNQQNGLKISNTSIVQKSFFVVPQTYFTKGGNSNSLGLLVEIVDEEGTKKQQFVPTDIYLSTEDSYYVSEEMFSVGTKILAPDASESFLLSEMKTLDGVYNINKGYAVFRTIDILYQNEEYTIVARNTPYGLSLYDHIALDGTIVTEDEIVNK